MKPSDTGEAAWAIVEAGNPPLPVLTPEDIILQKLRWYEAGGEVSDRQ